MTLEDIILFQRYNISGYTEDNQNGEAEEPPQNAIYKSLTRNEENPAFSPTKH